MQGSKVIIAHQTNVWSHRHAMHRANSLSAENDCRARRTRQDSISAQSIPTKALFQHYRPWMLQCWFSEHHGIVPHQQQVRGLSSRAQCQDGANWKVANWKFQVARKESSYHIVVPHGIPTNTTMSRYDEKSGHAKGACGIWWQHEKVILCAHHLLPWLPAVLSTSRGSRADCLHSQIRRGYKHESQKTNSSTRTVDAYPVCRIVNIKAGGSPRLHQICHWWIWPESYHLNCKGRILRFDRQNRCSKLNKVCIVSLCASLSSELIACSKHAVICCHSCCWPLHVRWYIESGVQALDFPP